MSTTTSSASAYVWTWLPGEATPVVAGRLEPRANELGFVYARSYRERANAISLYTPELPLRSGLIRPRRGMNAPGCILDGRPDSWGQRVILNRLAGGDWRTTDTGELSDLTYLLESGSDRVGALDFQRSSERYEPRRGAAATLKELMTSAARVEAGIPLTPALDAALLHGTSIGGARPKVQITDAGVAQIAKFSAADDTYPVVQAEYVGMSLAKAVGLRVATTSLRKVSGKWVLLVDRFDRDPGRQIRRHFVSALTILGLDELHARHASYADLAEHVRHSFTAPKATLRELFSRITFNILIGNTDDHARNHGALWDGEWLTLAPAYDLCPQLRSGGEASQGMEIGADHFRLSSLIGCVERAVEYGLTQSEAREVIDHQIDVIEAQWDLVCDEAELTHTDRLLLRQRAVLLPYAREGYSR